MILLLDILNYWMSGIIAKINFSRARFYTELRKRLIGSVKNVVLNGILL